MDIIIAIISAIALFVLASLAFGVDSRPGFTDRQSGPATGGRY